MIVQTVLILSAVINTSNLAKMLCESANSLLYANNTIANLTNTMFQNSIA